MWGRAATSAGALRSVIYVGYSAWRAITLFRMPRRGLLGCLEAASKAASVALMARALGV
jgi:hypothetical protein